MAFTIKGRKYNFAVIRKAFVSGIGAILAVLVAVIALGFLPTAIAVGAGMVVGILTGISTFLVRNARMIDALDGPDPEDSLI